MIYLGVSNIFIDVKNSIVSVIKIATIFLMLSKALTGIVEKCEQIKPYMEKNNEKTIVLEYTNLVSLKTLEKDLSCMKGDISINYCLYTNGEIDDVSYECFGYSDLDFEFKPKHLEGRWIDSSIGNVVEAVVVNNVSGLKIGQEYSFRYDDKEYPVKIVGVIGERGRFVHPNKTSFDESFLDFYYEASNCVEDNQSILLMNFENLKKIVDEPMICRRVYLQFDEHESKDTKSYNQKILNQSKNYNYKKWESIEDSTKTKMFYSLLTELVLLCISIIMIINVVINIIAYKKKEDRIYSIYKMLGMSNKHKNKILVSYWLAITIIASGVAIVVNNIIQL